MHQSDGLPQESGITQTLALQQELNQYHAVCSDLLVGGPIVAEF